MSLDPTLSIHLLSLSPGTPPSDCLSHFRPQEILIKGRPHGWVHKPHTIDRERLLKHDWDLFLVTQVTELPAAALELAKEHLSFQTAVPVSEYEALVANAGVKPSASSATPKIPEPWARGGIPQDAVVPGGAGSGPGELRLDEAMSRFLSTALPEHFADAPVSLFNLFKYKDGDRSTHDAYMADFKRSFGDSAGASVKFMGGVGAPIRNQNTDSAGGSGGGGTRKRGRCGMMQIWCSMIRCGTMHICWGRRSTGG
ncbi:hypothetical protein Tdes44962_MAKER04270 [Teratosphaeria destructans]|uniref:Uncharacterized protein n=1 Tax=Teratosphaeria destructans TaxID=418781 RepID=A0A9W7SMI0_9PEZI|nr:hypothetical protein Tdes44962_MAKER04270 [Teratosphaeria destructans]